MKKEIGIVALVIGAVLLINRLLAADLPKSPAPSPTVESQAAYWKAWGTYQALSAQWEQSLKEYSRTVAADAVGTFSGSSVKSGYTKAYLWDPRLPFYSPPYYLTPGTPSWNLVSSAESYTGACPTVPPAQSLPATSQPTFNLSTWSACSAP